MHAGSRWTINRKRCRNNVTWYYIDCCKEIYNLVKDSLEVLRKNQEFNFADSSTYLAGCDLSKPNTEAPKYSCIAKSSRTDCKANTVGASIEYVCCIADNECRCSRDITLVECVASCTKATATWLQRHWHIKERQMAFSEKVANLTALFSQAHATQMISMNLIQEKETRKKERKKDKKKKEVTCLPDVWSCSLVLHKHPKHAIHNLASKHEPTYRKLLTAYNQFT